MRNRRRLLALALTSVVAACGPSATATTTPTSVATAGPTAVPTSTATAIPGTATPPPAVTQRFTFGKDVVVSDQLAGTSDLYVNPGAVIEFGGTLHMYPNLFSAWPGRVRVPHLTSTDGIAWTRDANAAPLDSNDFKLADPGIDVSTGYVAADGTWVLLYETVSATKPWVIARATAPGPGGPWTVEATPIVAAGPAGSFDAGGVRWPSVLRIGGRWVMYYAGFDGIGPAATGAIGVAFSSDGLTWTRQATPVLTATEQWELGSLDRPRVVQTPAGLVMVYAGRDLKERALATSTDGLAWTKVPGPSIAPAEFPVTGGAWDCALLYRNGRLEFLLEIGGSTTNVYRATLAWP